MPRWRMDSVCRTRSLAPARDDRRLGRIYRPSSREERPMGRLWTGTVLPVVVPIRREHRHWRIPKDRRWKGQIWIPHQEVYQLCHAPCDGNVSLL